MRKAIMTFVALALAAVPSFAQKPRYSNSVSVFVSDLSFTSNASGSSFDSDFGAALEHMFSDRFSAELSVTSQRIDRYATTYTVGGLPATITSSDRVYPIDAGVSYHFFTQSRWKPYLGVGAHYVSDSVRGTSPVGNYRFSRRSTDAEVSGGVTYQFNPRLGLRLDAKQILGGSGDFGANAKLKGSVGLSLRF
ncbi:MAG: OmpW family [Thermoanaerobaculia bacterium]|jgi:outer membrane autotransporter protein|nr:OmpW family [Thermoanaerobaculia bacterium]